MNEFIAKDVAEAAVRKAAAGGPKLDWDKLGAAIVSGTELLIKKRLEPLEARLEKLEAAQAEREWKVGDR